MRLKNLPLDVHASNMTDEQAKEVAADLDARVLKNTTQGQRDALSLALLMVAHDIMAFGDLVKIQEGRETFGLAPSVVAEIKRLADMFISTKTQDGKLIYLVDQRLLDMMKKEKI